MPTPFEEGSTSTRRPYRFEAPTADELRSLSAAYTEITGRQVWPKMTRLMATCWRMHGPSTADVIRDLHAEHGVQDLLRRVIAHEADVTPPVRVSGVTDATPPPPTPSAPPPDNIGWHDDAPREWRSPQPSQTVSCRSYREHQPFHRRTPDGWVCDRCREAA